MLDRLRQLFERHVTAPLSSDADDAGADNAIKLATAALLIEMSRADFEVQGREVQRVRELLETEFGLSAQEVSELFERGETRADSATSLYEFTGLINSTFDAHHKSRLIRMLWDVAVAGGQVDRYEDHLVRKVADLIHVPHSVFIRTKLAALSAQEGGT